MNDSSVGTKPPRVFISYTHDSPEHRQRIVDLAAELRQKGIDAWIDRYEPNPPDGWPRWMTGQIEKADFVLMVCTETYCRRFEGKEEEGKGRGGRHEGLIVTQELYENDGKNRKFLPVRYVAEVDVIPINLRSFTHYHLPDGFDELYRHLTNQPEVVIPAIGEIADMPPLNAVPNGKDDAVPSRGAMPEQPILSEGTAQRTFEQWIVDEIESRLSRPENKILVEQLCSIVSKHHTSSVSDVGELTVALTEMRFQRAWTVLERYLNNRLSEHKRDVHQLMYLLVQGECKGELIEKIRTLMDQGTEPQSLAVHVRTRYDELGGLILRTAFKKELSFTESLGQRYVKPPLESGVDSSNARREMILHLMRRLEITVNPQPEDADDSELLEDLVGELSAFYADNSPWYTRHDFEKELGIPYMFEFVTFSGGAGAAQGTGTSSVIKSMTEENDGRISRLLKIIIAKTSVEK